MESQVKWEYKRLMISEYSPELIDGKYGKLKKFGDEGWELVSVDNGIAYFKRQIVSPNNIVTNVFVNGTPIDYKQVYDD